MSRLKLLSGSNTFTESSDRVEPVPLSEYNATEPMDLPGLAALYICCPSFCNHWSLLRKLHFYTPSVPLHAVVGNCRMMRFSRRFPSYVTSRPNDLPPFRAFKLNSSVIPPSLTLSGWRPLPANSWSLQSRRDAAFSATFRLQSQQDCIARMQTLCSQLPLHVVELISIGCQSSVAGADASDITDDYARLLECFPAVTRIELDFRCDYVDVQCVLAALLRTTTDASGHTKPLCPELHLDEGPTPTSDKVLSRSTDLVSKFAHKRLLHDRRLKLAEIMDSGRGLNCTFKYKSV